MAVEGEWDKRMKRNIVPLLGIAFVVAIVSTGVFYGLFAGRLKSSSSEITGQSIVVAAHDLQRGNRHAPRIPPVGDDVRAVAGWEAEHGR